MHTQYMHTYTYKYRTDTNIYMHTDRQRDKQTDIQLDIKKDKWTYKHRKTDRHAYIFIENRQIYIQKDTHSYIQTHISTERQIYRHTCIHI